MTQPKDGEGAEALLAQIDVMRKALEPFARADRDIPLDVADDTYMGIVTSFMRGPDALVRRDDFRRATEALAPPATPVRGGGNQELSVSQSQPGYDGERAASAGAEPSARARAEFDLLAAEFARPQFMTTTSGGDRHSLEFTFHGEEGRESRDALHDAIIAAAKAVNP